MSKQLCFFENRHVAYQIKENDIYTNIQAINLYFYTPLTHGVDQNVKTFCLKVVMLHIKFKVVKCTKTCKHLLCPDRWGLKVKTFFSESSLIAYQMNRKIGHAHTVFIYTKGGLGSGGGFL